MRLPRGVGEAEYRRELEANYFMRDRPERAAPRVELAGLHDVDWGALNDSYGPAYFVPCFIDALSSPDEADREWGLGALYASINHQGHPEQASPRAVPFLLELLAAPELPDPAAVLTLVTELAVGESRWCFEAGSDVAAFHRTSCYDGVACGAGLFVGLLGHAGAGVRAQAACACALIDACAAKAEAPLRRMAVEDPDPGARLTARVALGVVGRRNGTEVKSLLLSWKGSPEPWERASALAALAYAIADELEPEDRTALATAAPAEGEPPEHLCWDLATALRAQHVTTSVPRGLEAKLARVEGEPDAVAVECAKRALTELLAPQPGTSGEPWLPGDVKPELLRLLHALAANDALYQPVFAYSWDVPPELPLAREHLVRWLGIEPGPLDHVLELAPDRRWPVWRALHAVLAGDLEAGACAAAIADVFEPAALIELVEDALANLRWYAALGRLRPLDWREVNARVSRVLLLFGRLLATSAPGLAWARDQAELLLAGDRRQVTRELVVVLALAAAARARGGWLETCHQPLLNLDQAPASVYAGALAEAARSLAPERAEAFVASLPLHRFSLTSETRDDPETGAELERVECRYIHFPPFWELLPALAGEAAVRRVLEVLAEDQAHRRDHANRPERLRFRGCKDDDFPRELALETITGAGAAARPVLESFRGRLEDPSLLDEALAKLAESARASSA